MGTHFRDQDGYTQILEVTPRLRRRIKTTIDNLVALLDTIDPDQSSDMTLGRERSKGDGSAAQ